MHPPQFGLLLVTVAGFCLHAALRLNSILDTRNWLLWGTSDVAAEQDLSQHTKCKPFKLFDYVKGAITNTLLRRLARLMV